MPPDTDGPSITAEMAVTATVEMPAPAPIDKARLFLGRAQAAFAPATLRALRADGRLFADWCKKSDLCWLPALPSTIIAYIDAIGGTRRPATIQRYLSSIAMWHAAAEEPNPCDTLEVRLARKAHGRQQGSRQRQAAPLDGAAVRNILPITSDDALSPSPSPLVARDRAILLVAADSMARASEIVSLRWEDLEIMADGSGTLLIRRSKTDQAGQGRMAWLSPDAMQALAIWKTVRPQDAPWLFSNLDRAGKGPPGRLTATSVARIVKKRAAEVGLPGRSAHSTRVGGAQDLLAAGEDLPAIMQAGGWKTPAMALRYGERILAARGAMARQHGRRTMTKKKES